MSQTELCVENWMDILPPDFRSFEVTCHDFAKEILDIYKQAKKLFPDMYVNFLNGRRIYNWCGYRTPACAIGAPLSAHRTGKALDLHCGNLEALRGWATSKEGLAAGILRVEAAAATPTWVHIDVMPPNEARWSDRSRPYIFMP